VVHYCCGKKLHLKGFNNLTKSLSLNAYQLFPITGDGTDAKENENRFYAFIDKQYHSNHLAATSRQMADRIDATIISVSQHDFDPRGASAMSLISETNQLVANTTVAHLDKSHISIHTYPEIEPEATVATIRFDVDIATCGMISPLSVLDFLFETFHPAVAHIDYRVRGFTRNVNGGKHFIDHDIDSIQSFIQPGILEEYTAFDRNMPEINMFHTRLMQKRISAEKGHFKISDDALDENESNRLKEKLVREAHEIYNAGR